MTSSISREDDKTNTECDVFSELKLPMPNLLSKAKLLNVLILKIEGYDVRKRIRVK